MLFSAFRRSAIGSLLALALFRANGARAASAESEERSSNPLDLVWVSPDPNCDGATVRTRALELLPAGVEPRSFHARAELTREGNEWLVQLETHSANNTGRRVLRGSSCQEIQQAMALLLAMILEAESRAEEAPASPQPIPVPPPPPPPPPELIEPPVDAPPPSRTPRLGWLMRVGGDAAYGVQPGLGLGLGASIGGTWNEFEFGLQGSYWPITRVSAFDGTATLEISREIFELVGCYRLLRWGRFELAPCLAPGLTLARWRSKGIDIPRYGRTGTQPSLVGSLDLRFRILQPLFLAVGPGITWERSQAFGTGRVDNCGDQCRVITLFEARALSPRLTVAIGARF